MKNFLLPLMLISSPLVMNASGDTLKTDSLSIKRWNITASVGYGFPFAKHVLGNEGTGTNASNTTSKLIRGTYGKGVFSFISVGYAINQHFGSEFGIHSTWGDKITTYDMTYFYGNYHTERSTQASTSGMFIGFFITDAYSKFHVSFHNDLLVGVMNTLTERSFFNGVQNPAWEYSGGISYGWLSRIGGSFDISDKMNIGLNGFFLMHNWSPAQKERLNGSNKFTFTDNTSTNAIVPPPSNQLPRVTYPLHAAGVNLLIAYNF